MASSKLLSLPAELRIRIWAYVVVEDEGTCTYVASRVVHKLGPSPTAPDQASTAPDPTIHAHRTRQYKVFPEPPALCQVSMQLRKDNFSMFYGLNTFILHHDWESQRAEELLRWLSLLGSCGAATSGMRHFVVELPGLAALSPPTTSVTISGQPSTVMANVAVDVKEDRRCKITLGGAFEQECNCLFYVKMNQWLCSSWDKPHYCFHSKIMDILHGLDQMLSTPNWRGLARLATNRKEGAGMCLNGVISDGR